MAKQTEHNPFMTTQSIAEALSRGYVPFIEVSSNGATLSLEVNSPEYVRVDILRVVG